MHPVTTLIMVVILSMAGVACGSGTTLLRTTDDAARYVDDAVRGKSLDHYEPAPGAAPAVTAALHDQQALKELHQIAAQAPDAACFVGSLAKAQVDSQMVSDQVVLYDIGSIQGSAAERRIPPELTEQLTGVYQRMARRTLLEAVDRVCNLRNSGL